MLRFTSHHHCIFIIFVFVSHIMISMSYFYKDNLKDHDLIVHTNCLSDYAIQHSQYLHREVSHVHMEPDTNFVLNLQSPSLVLICPTNDTELLLYLKTVASVSTAKTVSPQPVYIFHWPGPISTCSSSSVSNTEQYIRGILKNTIFQSIVKSYPMDVDVYISFNCKNTPENNQLSTYFVELYSVHKTVPVIQTLVKDLSRHELSSEDIVNKVERRSNFRGAAVRGIYYVASNFKDLDNKTILKRLHEFIASILNMTLVLVDGKGWIGNTCFEWGKESDDFIDCPLTGMGQQILSDEADMILENTELVSYRVRYLKALQPVNDDRVSAIFRQPHGSLLRNIYIKSFSPSLWLILSLTLVVIIGSVVAVCRMMPRIHSWTEEIIDIEEDNLIMQATMWLLSSMSMQGWHISASSLPMKIIHISVLALAMVCYAVYSGTIFSILSNQKGPITNFDSLVKSDLPVVADAWTLNAIRTAEGVHIKRGLPTSIKLTNRDNMLETYELINSSNIALLTNKNYWLRFAFYKNITTLNDVCKTFSVFTNSFGTPIMEVMYIHRNSSLREYLNYPIVVLTETGLRHRFMSIYQSTKHFSCFSPEDLSPQAFGTNDVFSLYMVLLTGFISSLFLLIKEKIQFYLAKFNNKR